MVRKKPIRKFAQIDKSVTENTKWKILKITLIGIAVSFGIFLIVKNSKNLNLSGDWKLTKIVLNDKDLLLPSYPSNKFLNIIDEIKISEYGNPVLFSGDSIFISINQQKISAKFKIEHDIKYNYSMKLHSKEKSLNGRFDMKIDTMHLGPQEYIVRIKLNYKTTYLYFQRHKIIPQWKPELPRRGQV